MDQIVSALQAIGLDRWVPVLLAVHALASALDAAIPQPASGSHWLPVRKLVSLAAGNVGNATNLLQPPLVTWAQRIILVLAAVVPEPVQPGAQPAPTAAPKAD